MNKQIKELAEQCWEESQCQPAWFNHEKFAELIVRECINRVRSRQMFATEDGHTINHAFDLLVYDIESQFGVEP